MARKPPADPPATVDFEASLAELETLVERLEQGDLPLEQALDHFERGVGLTRQCQGALASAQQKVEQLLGDGSTSAFNTAQDADDD